MSDRGQDHQVPHTDRITANVHADLISVGTLRASSASANGMENVPLYGMSFKAAVDP